MAALVPADDGESASTFLATGRDGTVSVLKISPDAVGDSAGRLRELVARLRRRGYAAARLLASGQVAGLTFWLQEQLPGTVLERVPVPGWLIPEVLRLNDARADLGDGTRQLSGLIAATLTAGGGDGYCVHATFQARPDTRDLLAVVRQTADRCLAAVPERDDFVHYDFTLANLLTTGPGISGVIDINRPRSPATGRSTWRPWMQVGPWTLACIRMAGATLRRALRLRGGCLARTAGCWRAAGDSLLAQVSLVSPRSWTGPETNRHHAHPT